MPVSLSATRAGNAEMAHAGYSAGVVRYARPPGVAQLKLPGLVWVSVQRGSCLHL